MKNVSVYVIGMDGVMTLSVDEVFGVTHYDTYVVIEADSSRFLVPFNNIRYMCVETEEVDE